MVMEILLGDGGFHMDRGAEMSVLDADIDVQKSDMGRGSVPSEVVGIAIVELFQESSKGVQVHGARVRICHQ